jgi:hypothetical protein
LTFFTITDYLLAGTFRHSVYPVNFPRIFTKRIPQVLQFGILVLKALAAISSGCAF